MSCLRARSVRFGYGGPAATPLIGLDGGLDLDVREGEFLGILGPNGAGKTTLLRLLSGMLRPHSGDIELDGRSIASYRPVERARRIAYVPQESRPAFDYEVIELVLMGRAPHLGLLGIEGRRDVDIAFEALEFTDAHEFARRRFGSLSAGEKQRVLLARALAQQAAVIVLDEPTAFLDLRHQQEIYDLLARLRAERATTPVVVSHDLNLAGRFCDRLVLMCEGRLVADGAPAEVLTAARIRETWGVEAVVHHLPGSGPLVVPSAPGDRR